MSKKALVPVNILATGTAPSAQHAGDLYFNSSESSVYVHTGSTWTTIPTGSIDAGTPDSNYGGLTVVDCGGI